MSKHDKLIQKIETLKYVSFSEAQKLLEGLGYSEKSTGLHHSFRKPNCETITIKKRDPIHKEAVKELRKILKHQ